MAGTTDQEKSLIPIPRTVLWPSCVPSSPGGASGFCPSGSGLRPPRSTAELPSAPPPRHAWPAGGAGVCGCRRGARTTCADPRSSAAPAKGSGKRRGRPPLAAPGTGAGLGAAPGAPPARGCARGKRRAAREGVETRGSEECGNRVATFPFRSTGEVRAEGRGCWAGKSDVKAARTFPGVTPASRVSTAPQPHGPHSRVGLEGEAYPTTFILDHLFFHLLLLGCPFGQASPGFTAVRNRVSLCQSKEIHEKRNLGPKIMAARQY